MEEKEMSFVETMEYIDSLRAYGVVPGLDNMRRLCARLENPQDDLKFVHIAGTNGKGSVLCFLSAVLAQAGYRVGSYSSPAVADYRDTIQTGGRMISRAWLCRGMTRICAACRALVEAGYPHPTLFEAQTALAFLYFKEKKCDIVVLETGMGGELDATNIVKNTVVSVFTPVSMDHVGVLGNSLAQIAWTKSGIIKAKGRAVSSQQEPEALEAIRLRCREQNAPLTVTDLKALVKKKSTLAKQTFSYGERKNLEISLAGRYQTENAALAIEALDVLSECGYPVTDKALRAGLLGARWPGRFQILGTNPLFIADGAHNEDAAGRLADTLGFYFRGEKLIYIMGMLRDKDHEAVIKQTCPLAGTVLTVPTPGERGLSAYELAGEVMKYHGDVTALDSVEEAVEIAYMLSGGKTPVIAFGSLSYLGKLMETVDNRNKKKK